MKPAWLAALATVVCIVLHAAPASAAAVAPAGSVSRAAVVELLVIQLANTRANSNARLSSEQRAAAYRLAESETRLTREIRERAEAERREHLARRGRDQANARLRVLADETAALESELRAVRAQMRAQAEAAAAADQVMAEELAAYRQVMTESLETASPEKLGAWERFAQGDLKGAFPILVELSRAENLARTRAADKLAAKVRSATAGRNAANLRPVAMGALTMVLDGELLIQDGIKLWLEIIGDGPGTRADHVFIANLYQVDANDRLAREHMLKAAALPKDQAVADNSPETAVANAVVALATDEALSFVKYFDAIAVAATPAGQAVNPVLGLYEKLAACADRRGGVFYSGSREGVDPPECVEADAGILAALQSPENDADERNLLLRAAVLLAQGSILEPVLCFRDFQETDGDGGCQSSRKVVARASFDATLAICRRLSRADPADRRWVCGQALLVASMRALEREAAVAAARDGLALAGGTPLPGRRAKDLVDFLRTAALAYSLMDEKVLAAQASGRAVVEARRIATAPGALGRDDVELARVIATHGEDLVRSGEAGALKGLQTLIEEELEIRRRRPNSLEPCYALDQIASDLFALMRTSEAVVGLDLLDVMSKEAASCEALAEALEEKHLRDSAATYRRRYVSVGIARSGLEDHAGARIYLEKAIARDAQGEPIEDVSGYGHGTVRTLQLLAISQEELEDFPAARESYEDIVRLSRAATAPPRLPVELLPQAPLLAAPVDPKIADWAKASLAGLRASLEAAGPPTDGPYAFDLLRLAQLNDKLGRPDEAERGYLEVIEQANIDSWMADAAASSLASRYSEAGDHRRALPFLERGVAYQSRQLAVRYDPAATPADVTRAERSEARPSRLAWSQYWLARAQLRLGDTAGFKASLSSILATSRFGQLPAAAEAADAQDLAGNLLLMGRVLAQEPARAEDARALYERSQDIANGLPEGEGQRTLQADLKAAFADLPKRRP